MSVTNRKPQGQRSFTRMVNFNSAGYATGILLGILPQGAYPTGIVVDVVTAFDISAGNRSWIGFAFNSAEWATGVELDVLGSKTYMRHLTEITSFPLAADRNVVFSGYGSPTVGSAIVRVTFDN